MKESSNNYRSQTVSAILITHNNESCLEPALESLKWSDEIIIIDQGSTDATLKIARKYTKNVFFHPSKDQALLRQYALKQAKKEWILFLEPYEWVEEMLRHKIDGVLLNPNGTDGFTIPIHFYWQGSPVSQGGMSKQEMRLIRRQKARVVDDIYFSGYELDGNSIALEKAIGSEPYQDFKTLASGCNNLSTRAAYRVLEAGGPYRFRKSSLNLLIRPLYTFFYRYIIRQGFFQGMTGLTLAYATSIQSFLKYAKFRSLLKQKSDA